MSFSSPLRPYSHQAFPLSPRSPNIQTFTPQMPNLKTPSLMSPPVTPTTSRSDTSTSQSFPFADFTPSRPRTDPRIPQRRFETRNPLARSQADRQTACRDKFLDGVKGRKEERTWGVRVDQISRQKFFSEQREWEERNAREAPALDEMPEDEMLGDTTASASQQTYEHFSQQVAYAGQQHDRQAWPIPTGRQDVIDTAWSETKNKMQDEADALARAEQEEMEALIAMEDQAHAMSPVYGSEDEEMDEAMVELVEQTGGDGMDMS